MNEEKLKTGHKKSEWIAKNYSFVTAPIMERILALMSKNYKCENKTIVGITYDDIKFQF